MKAYAGIGSRETPDDIMQVMIYLGTRLGKLGYTLRSGGADGADSAFEEGAIGAGGNAEIYLPWKGFNSNSSPLYDISPEALKIAEQFHPAWGRLNQAAKKLMARNCHQVLGNALNDPVDFVIAWTKDGKASGGTGQAIRIANHYNIPVYNLYNGKDGIALHAFMHLQSTKG